MKNNQVIINLISQVILEVYIISVNVKIKYFSIFAIKKQEIITNKNDISSIENLNTDNFISKEQQDNKLNQVLQIKDKYRK